MLLFGVAENDFVHLVQVGNHIPAQRNLVAGTNQVMLRILGREIQVSTEIIVQEPDSQLGGEADACLLYTSDAADESLPV